MEEHNPPSIEKHVTDAIKNGDVAMIPKWHFILRAVLTIVGAALLFGTVLYLASFILFMTWRTGIGVVPLFGLRGVMIFLRSLPWLLIALSILFVVILEVLVKRYTFAYRRPLLYSIAGIILIIFIGGIIIANTPLHRQLFRAAEQNRLPFAGPMYRKYGHPRIDTIYRGEITAFKPDGLILRNEQGDSLFVQITRRTRLPFGNEFSVGDTIIVFGDIARPATSTVKAFGIKKIDE